MAASNDVRKDLASKLNTWTKKESGMKTKAGNLSEKEHHKKVETAGANDPKYMMYWTNEDLLTLIAKSFVKTGETPLEKPLGPSSTIILEIIPGVEGEEMTIDAFVDDQKVAL
jgi:hypothetical protein